MEGFLLVQPLAGSEPRVSFCSPDALFYTHRVKDWVNILLGKYATYENWTHMWSCFQARSVVFGEEISKREYPEQFGGICTGKGFLAPLRKWLRTPTCSKKSELATTPAQTLVIIPEIRQQMWPGKELSGGHAFPGSPPEDTSCAIHKALKIHQILIKVSPSKTERGCIIHNKMSWNISAFFQISLRLSDDFSHL